MALSPELLNALVRLLPDKDVLTNPQDLHTYGFDGTAALHCTPAAVAFPRSTQQVADILRWASSHRIPVVTRGSGTGLSGGSVPIPDSIVLCTVHLDRILDVEPDFLEAGHHHHHDSDIRSVSAKIEGAVDPDKFMPWISNLTQSQGPDILRCKGIVAFRSEEHTSELQSH